MAGLRQETSVPSLRPALPFRPNKSQTQQMPLFQQNKVPRYLFRIYTPKTAGKTTPSYVVPSASTCGHNDRTQDIFSLPPAKAATFLNEHLNWFEAHESNCNLISWTASLLLALHYGLHRHGGCRHKSKLEEISLSILDTTTLPAGTFISEMEIMKVFVEHECPFPGQKKTLRGLFDKVRNGPDSYHFGEYLSQGDLDIKENVHGQT